MAWESPLATAEEAKEYIGNTRMTDVQLEAAANAMDALIIDDFGPHPVIQLDDPPAESAVKGRALARRKLAFLSLVQLEDVDREQRNPAFKGVRMGAENMQEKRQSALAKIGLRPAWSVGNGEE